MKAEDNRKEGGKREGAKSSETRPKSVRRFVMFEGRKYALFKERSGTWRIRSRNKSHPFSAGLNATDYNAARQLAIEALEQKEPARKSRGFAAVTLETIARVYVDLPKRTTERVAKLNVSRLRTVCREVFSRELDAVKLSELSARTWREFFRLRHGGKLDLATRRPENAALNAAVRMARSIFIDKLRPSYAEEGISFSKDITIVEWLPERKKLPAAADDAAFLKWWNEQAEQTALWWATGLARFAGLRRGEIAAMTPEWLVDDDGQSFVQLADREGVLTKTGEIYRAPILSARLADAIKAAPKGKPLVNPDARIRDRWFSHDLPGMVRVWTGTATKPLHRLRGLYADHVAQLTKEAVTAKLAAVQAASKALGHTNTKTTLNHYLSPL